MRHLRTHPLRVLATLLVVAFALFLSSGIPRYRDATAGADAVVGDILWFGFLIAALLFVVSAVLAAVSALHHRSVA